MRMPLRLLTVLLTLTSLTTGIHAQTLTPEAHRDYQLRMLEHQRKLLLAMADSMPEKLYRDRAAPGQRDFAQQIHHAASGAAFVAGQAMKSKAPALPDTAKALNSRAGLKSVVNRSYDHLAELLKGQTPQDRAEMADVFGQKMPRWQVWDEIHSHTLWTAGQAVANFRKHGMAPPAFSFF
jgi:hypothetical protein